MNSISVIICAYNEQENIGVVLKESLDVLSHLTNDYEIIVVDDGSTDQTLRVTREMAHVNSCIKIIQHSSNQGMGRSLLDGYSLAQKSWVTFLPADGQISSQDIELLSKPMKDNDMVVSYYAKRDLSLYRIILSKGIRLALFLLFGPMPKYEGTYMFRREILEKIQLKMHTSFVLNYEFVIRAKKQGFRVAEVPTTCYERLSGHSKVLGLKKIFFILKEIFLFRFKY
jgi:glycosyltransferase involved in cell wall biosynthesis